MRDLQTEPLLEDLKALTEKEQAIQNLKDNVCALAKECHRSALILFKRL